jgi:hypothetical protein
VFYYAESLLPFPVLAVSAMILQKYTKSVDGTIPVPALLYDDEENYASQDGVGIYDGYCTFPYRRLP